LSRHRRSASATSGDGAQARAGVRLVLVEAHGADLQNDIAELHGRSDRRRRRRVTLPDACSRCTRHRLARSARGTERAPRRVHAEELLRRFRWLIRRRNQLSLWRDRSVGRLCLTDGKLPFGGCTVHALPCACAVWVLGRVQWHGRRADPRCRRRRRRRWRAHWRAPVGRRGRR
jgi:hypothetical protein